MVLDWLLLGHELDEGPAQTCQKGIETFDLTVKVTSCCANGSQRAVGRRKSQRRGAGSGSTGLLLRSLREIAQLHNISREIAFAAVCG
jgi:hypothetical protein